MKIVLVGYMYAGKTTVGKRIANMLNFSFVDTDKRVEEICLQSVEEIFDRVGEEYFRQKEREVFLSLLKEDNIVIATGGGLPCYKDNMNLINLYCKSIYLELSPAQIFSRLNKSNNIRPLLKNIKSEDRLEFIETSLQARESFYRKADITLSALSINKEELEKRINELFRRL
ncbi:MAG: shikimate kinase [Bacteroidota bacterium]|nr:shikimate kinase [Bacteroidota bacterium]